MKQVSVKTSQHSEMIDITRQIQEQIPDSFSGVCTLFCLHTTAGLTLNENADPDVIHDMLLELERLVPWRNPDFRHGEGNSAAHVKSTLVGPDLNVPVDNGKLLLGTWQGIYFCEFDGPRNRKVGLQLTESAQ